MWLAWQQAGGGWEPNHLFNKNHPICQRFQHGSHRSHPSSPPFVKHATLLSYGTPDLLLGGGGLEEKRIQSTLHIPSQNRDRIHPHLPRGHRMMMMMMATALDFQAASLSNIIQSTGSLSGEVSMCSFRSFRALCICQRVNCCGDGKTCETAVCKWLGPWRENEVLERLDLR